MLHAGGSDKIKLLKKGYNCVGVDISFDAVRLANKKIVTFGFSSKGFAVVGDAENIPFESNKFDGVYICAALHHLLDVTKALTEMKRSVKQDGIVVIASEPNSFWWRYLKWVRYSRIGERFLKIFRKESLEKTSPRDMETPGFSRKDLIQLTNSVGLQIVQIKPIWFLNGFIDLT